MWTPGRCHFLHPATNLIFPQTLQISIPTVAMPTTTRFVAQPEVMQRQHASRFPFFFCGSNNCKLQRQQIGYLEAKIFLSPVYTAFSNVSKLRSRRQISSSVTTCLTYSSLPVDTNIPGNCFSHSVDRASWYTWSIQTNRVHFSYLIYSNNLSCTCVECSSPAGSYCICSIWYLSRWTY